MIIFLYIVFSVYSYFTRDQIRFYEVLKGGIVRQEAYTGVAIRQEQTVNAGSSGYIHYYIQEGKRVAVGSDAYTIDETGALETYLSEHPELTTEMSSEQVSDIRYRLSSFSQDFKNRDFYELYDTKYSLDASALEYSSISGTQDLDTALSQLGINYTRVKADKTGVVSYAIDGYESLTEANVTKDIFSMNGYKKTITKPGSLIESGAPVYKLITSETWSIVFPLTDEEKTKYQDVKSIKIHFPDKDIKDDASLSIYTAADGNNYGKITMNDLMEEFCGDRFIQFEIETNDENGLKIPLSCIAEKEFYVVPKDFMVTNDDGTVGFNKQVVADGGTGSQFTETEIYRIDDQYCYLNVPDDKDTAALKSGDFISKAGTEQNYQIGPTKTIQGVYNINKGYCVFRQIVPIEQNNEYMIVEENTDYGISVYDHIVLDASLVSEGQLIYQ